MTVAVFLLTVACVAAALCICMSVAWLIWRSHAQLGLGRHDLDLQRRCCRACRRGHAADRGCGLGRTPRSWWLPSPWRGRCVSACTSHAARAASPTTHATRNSCRAGARTPPGRCSCWCRSRRWSASRSALPWCWRPRTRRPALRLQDWLARAGVRGRGIRRVDCRRAVAPLRAPTRPIAARSAMSVSGAGRAIRIISSNGWAGSPIRCSPSARGSGAGSRSRRRPACTGCWFTSPACLRWKRTCSPRSGDAYRAYQARTNAFFPAPPLVK